MTAAVYLDTSKCFNRNEDGWKRPGKKERVGQQDRWNKLSKYASEALQQIEVIRSPFPA